MFSKYWTCNVNMFLFLIGLCCSFFCCLRKLQPEQFSTLTRTRLEKNVQFFLILKFVETFSVKSARSLAELLEWKGYKKGKPDWNRVMV